MLDTKVVLDKFGKMLSMTYFILDTKTKEPLYSNLKKRTYAKAQEFIIDSKLLDTNKLYVAQIDTINVVTFFLNDFEGHEEVTFLFMSSHDTGDLKNRLYINNLLELINVVVYIITGNDIDFTAEQFFFDSKRKKLLTPLEFVHISLTRDFTEKRVTQQYHQSYFEEKMFMDAIKNGTPELLSNLTEADHLAGIGEAKLANTELRHSKNMLISLITLTTRSAIEGGFSNEEAYLLSDRYIQLVEEMIDIKNLSTLSTEIMVDFSQRVQETNRSNVSRTIYYCQEYISIHIYEKITVAELAENLHMNPNYLSTKFKSETGIALSAYIQQQKVEEAKKMILYAEYDFSEIYSMLHFSDQSHFIKTFKKHTGMLPSEYKEKHIFQ